MRNRLLLWAERALLAGGLALLVLVALALVHRSMGSRLALQEFDRAQAAFVQSASHPSAAMTSDEAVDFSLWSEKRVRLYRESLAIRKEAPVAVLSIARLKIRVPVFEGAGDLILNRGVGWIAGTAAPGATGDANVGIAGHRDGFFRGLKDIAVGDSVELATPGAVSVYQVDSMEIVYPADVRVLKPRGVPSLTLATCYPFYFIGDAPQRFIVHATLKNQVSSNR